MSICFLLEKIINTEVISNMSGKNDAVTNKEDISQDKGTYIRFKVLFIFIIFIKICCLVHFVINV